MSRVAKEARHAADAEKLKGKLEDDGEGESEK